MKIVLICIFLWAIVSITFVGLKYAEEPRGAYTENKTFATNETLVDRFYDEDAGVVCYVSVYPSPSISCLRIK